MTNWTEEQNSAINNRGGNLLISAAAGSGKTAVLVERVIKRITEEKIDINKFLLVTFTEAAASEMRTKIINAISKKLSQEPQNFTLARQLRLTYHAKITTIHSFCLGIIRENAHLLGIRQDFRIADTTETAEILKNSIDEVLEENYRLSSPEFLILAENSISGQDDRALYNIIYETFQKVQSAAFPLKLLDEMHQDYQNFSQVNNSKWMREIINHAEEVLKYSHYILTNALTKMEDTVLYEKYSSAFLSDISKLSNLISKIERGNYDDFVDELGKISYEKLGIVRNFDDIQFKEQILDIRKNYKENIKKLSQDIFCFTSEEIISDISSMKPFVKALTQITKEVINKFSEHKRSRNILDFADLEHFMAKLVTKINPDGTISKSEFAENLHFEEIMVDEYQDTNDVQDLIFTALSDGNIFMVGDVKQSIYRFRLANPSIFLSKYLNFSDAEHAEIGENRKIILSKNFRSRKEILNYVNFVFETLMSENFGGITYGTAEKLYLGLCAPNVENFSNNTEFYLIDNTIGEDDEGESLDKIKAEALFVSSKITDMIETKFPVTDKTSNRLRPCTMSDFAILLRSPGKKQKFYKDALENSGITAVVSEDEDLLSFPEISVIISFLTIIDNPDQDIPLIAVLRSPLYNFSEDELTQLRLISPESNIYECLNIMSELGNKKCTEFLFELSSFSNYSYNLPVHMLVYKIFDTKNVNSIYGAMPNGSARIKRLNQFFEFSRNFENTAYKGLFKFLCHLRRIFAQEDGVFVTNTENSQGVKIMSIHKSKGLEFPIVFLCDITKRFNLDEMRSPALIDNSLGIAPYCRDNIRKIIYPSLPRIAISENLKRQSLEEELRVLYVALTRPKDKLIIIGSYNNLERTLRKLSTRASDLQLSSYYLRTINNYGDWLLLCALRHISGEILCKFANIQTTKFLFENEFDVKIIKSSQIKMKDIHIPVTENKIDSYEPISFPEYPYFVSTDIPSKLTATEVNRKLLPDTVEKVVEMLKKPQFLSKEQTLTPAEKGIAHHLFMQLCNFDTINSTEDVLFAAQNMLNKQLLSEIQVAAIDSKKIMGFFNSSLFERLKNSQKVLREYKFSVLIPAKKYYNSVSNDEILLQGVIDCMFFENDKWVIIDFKTDYVTNGNMYEKANSYKEQLQLYKFAVERIFKQEVSQIAIYFFSTASEVILN